MSARGISSPSRHWVALLSIPRARCIAVKNDSSIRKSISRDNFFLKIVCENYSTASGCTPLFKFGRRIIKKARTYEGLKKPINPCGNFSGTSSLKFRGTKGSIGHTFMVCIHTENQNQGDFYPFVPLEISVLHESPLGHLRYGLTDVPPQPNSPPNNVINPDRPARDLNARSWAVKPSSASLIK